MYNEKYLKDNIKSYNGKTKTIFNSNKAPKESCKFIYVSVSWIDFVFEVGKNYCPKVFVGECRIFWIEKILMTKILMKEIKYRIPEYYSDSKLFIKYSYNLDNSYNKGNF